MPGLTGIIDFKNKIEDDVLPEMVKVQIHEKFYSVEKFNFQDNIHVARIKTGLIDEGEFPYTEDNLVILFAGEMFNDECQSISSQSFIASQYKQHGENFLNNLNGSFTLLLIDKGKMICYLSTDRNWHGNLFYAEVNNRIFFSSEYKSISGFLQKPLKPSNNAIVSFMTSGSLIGGEAFIEGIKALYGGKSLMITPVSYREVIWWRIKFTNERKDNPDLLYDEMKHHLMKAVERRIRTKGNYALALSGGWDSKGILALFLKQKEASDIKTISWGYNQHLPDSDGYIARDISDMLNIKHFWFEYNPHDFPLFTKDYIRISEGIIDDLLKFPSSFNHFKAIREVLGIEILLHGDQYFGYDDIPDNDLEMYEHIGLNYLENQSFLKRILKRNAYMELDDINREIISSYLKNAEHYENRLDKRDFVLFYVRKIFFQGPGNYFKHKFFISRNPGLDYDLFNFVTSLSGDFRKNKYLYKKVICDIEPRLFKIQAESNNEFSFKEMCLKNPGWSKFLYQTLLEKDSILSEYVDLNKLKEEIDLFLIPDKKPSLVRSYTKRIPQLKRIYRSVFPQKHNLEINSGRLLHRLLSLQLTFKEFLK
ncbi:MAG: hypothetical protein JXA60_06105 [Candidatus Coatesbacteria bacterium]|nr:hypothetical protein [Candidatus Coatesbacteria bacterium]